MSTTILYHNDDDGFGAAFALWLTLRSGIYIPVQYGQEVPEIPKSTKRLYIVDFSYDRATCEDLANQYELTILDHHKTAEKELDGLPYATFDMGKSGAGLAWEHMNRGVLMPPILCYVQDRDLWKFELPHSEEVNLYISTLPKTFEAWADFDLHLAVGAGTILKTYRDQQINEAVEKAELIKFGDHGDVPAVNTTVHISEIGHVLLEKYPESPFSVMIFYTNKDVIFSLRSRDGEFDVGELARLNGGGGHTYAAGFKKERAPI